MPPTPPLTILLVGNGGREHALAWKLSQSPHVTQIYAVPGNGGTSLLPKTVNISTVKPDDFAGLVAFSQQHSVNFLVPGPEAPLVDGIVDFFAEKLPELKVFGPSRKAAVMEGSKTFAKDFMKRHAIPTADYQNFFAYEPATKYLDSVAHDVVIKADGLAAGKGVIIPRSKEEAHAALKSIMLDKEFGKAGNDVVIEEYLDGQELSILSFCDGEAVKSLPPSQDHKRIFDGDHGPNTGGMGTYAPTDIVTKELQEEIERTILEPTIKGMKQEGFPFIGTLFTGLMLTQSGPKVLEYNVRFGDPETQSVLALLESDLAEIMYNCTCSALKDVDLQISPKYATTVVVAAGGYPGPYSKGTEIRLDATESDTYLFHAGTVNVDGKLITSGGRVIASTATGNTLKEAVDKSYKGVEVIHFEGMQFRRDIATRALK
ncbi:phosphoribosylglycinamide synthetase [Lineolata rhizophorae]|uniref:phosphoribosylamine--glycine ligase n=1 Tax=Lineolata rhizophorae TaxID=578093 RepID=A0A6A6NZH9_9PEZI|nr:phosphoribosylglycinamide synthetase [Lineolata rhizophorae]